MPRQKLKVLLRQYQIGHKQKKYSNAKEERERRVQVMPK